MNKSTNFSYILFAFFSLFSLAIIDNTRGPIYPEILNQFNISNSLGALIFSISSLTSFLITLFSKKWGKRYGAVNSVKAAIGIHIIAIFLMGISGKYQNGYYVFLLASALFGVGLGIMSISLNLIVANFSPILKRRKYFATLHSMYGLASFIAPMCVSLAFQLEIQWQNLILLLTLVPIAVFIYGVKLPKQGIVESNISNFKIPLKTLVSVGIIFSFYVSSEVLVSSRLALYLRTFWKQSASVASQNLAIFFLLLLLGRLMFAIFHVKINTYKLMVTSILSTIIFYILGLYIHPLFLVGTGLTMSYYFPNALEWVSSRFKGNSDYVISQAMIFIGGMLVGMHWIFGGISDLYGIQIAMHLGPIMLLIALYLLHTQR